MKRRNERRKPRVRIARGVLHSELVFLVLCGVALLLEYLTARMHNPILADSQYPAMTEYLVAGIVIAVGTFVFADLLEREGEERG